MLKEDVEKVIDVKIRPYLLNHGGDLEVIAINNGVVKIKLLGQCVNCISAKDTIENLVEAVLKKEFSQINKVKLENYMNEDILDMARKILNKKH